MGYFILFIVLGTGIAIACKIVSIYNNLVTLKNNVRKCWSNIDIVLKQRHDEIPKLVVVCQEYMKFEQETFQNIAEARSKASEALAQQNVGGLIVAEKQLQSSMGHLFAVAEAYPELKTNESFCSLQKRITQLENVIADRREEYNEAVNNLNITIEQFPDQIIASGRFFPAKMLEIDKAETQDPNLKALFKSE